MALRCSGFWRALWQAWGGGITGQQAEVWKSRSMWSPAGNAGFPSPPVCHLSSGRLQGRFRMPFETHQKLFLIDALSGFLSCLIFKKKKEEKRRPAWHFSRERAVLGQEQ